MVKPQKSIPAWACIRQYLAKTLRSVAARSSVVFAWYLLSLSLPLVLFSLEIPVPTWDFFTGVPLYLPFGWSEFSSVWKNFAHNMFGEMDKVRPTLALVYQLHYAAFGGELWLWYLVRWLAKLVALLAVDWSLRRLRIAPAPRAVVLALAAFQPAVFELMPTSADGWLALFCSLVVALATAALPEPGGMTLPADSRRHWLLAAITLTGLLTLGTKEAGLAVAPLLIFAAIVLGRSLRERILYCAVALTPVAFFAWRIAVAASHRGGQRSLGVWLERIFIELRFVGPHLPVAVWWLLAAVGAWAAIRAIGCWSQSHSWLALMCLGTATTLLVLTSVPGNHPPAPRYVVPILFLLGVPLALMLEALPRHTQPVMWLVALVLPLVEMGDITSQYAGYSQTLREYADVVAELRSKAASGRSVAMSGHYYELAQYAFGLEEQASTKALLEEYGPRFYHERPVPVLPSLADTVDHGPVALLTVYPPGLVARGVIEGLALENVERVSTIRRRTRGGALSYARTWKRFERTVGLDHWPTFDVGAPGPDATSRFFIYDVPRSAAGRTVCQRPTRATSVGMPITPGRSEHVLNPQQAHDFEGVLTGPLIVRVPLGDLVGTHAVVLAGTMSIKQGTVVLAISDAVGNDLWSTSLTAGTQTAGIAAIPALDFAQGRQYFAVLFVPNEASATVAIDDLAVDCAIPIELIEPSRGLGTLSD